MSLKKQKLQLIADYRAHGQDVMSEALAVEVLIPFLETIARTLKLEHVYFWAEPSQPRLCVFTLQNPRNSADIKRTIYFFASEQDAKRHPHYERSQHRIEKLPILPALFHFLSTVDEIDQAIFYPQKGRLKESKTLDMKEFVRDLSRRRNASQITAPLAKPSPFGLA